MLSLHVVSFVCLGWQIVSLSLSIFIKCNKSVSWEGEELAAAALAVCCSIITSGDGAVVVVVVVVAVVVVLAVFSVGSRRAQCSHVSSNNITIM